MEAAELRSGQGVVSEVFAQCGLVELEDGGSVALHLGDFTVRGRRPPPLLNDLSDFLCLGQRLRLVYAALPADAKPHHYHSRPVPSFASDYMDEKPKRRLIVGVCRDVAVLRPAAGEAALGESAAAVGLAERWTRDRKARVLKVDEESGEGLVETELGVFAFLPMACVRDAGHCPGDPHVLPRPGSQVIVRTFARPPNRSELIVVSVAPALPLLSFRTPAFVYEIQRNSVMLSSPFGPVTAPWAALRFPKPLSGRPELRERVSQALVGAAVMADVVESVEEPPRRLPDGRPMRWKASEIRLERLPRHLADRAQLDLSDLNGHRLRSQQALLGDEDPPRPVKMDPFGGDGNPVADPFWSLNLGEDLHLDDVHDLIRQPQAQPVAQTPAAQPASHAHPHSLEDQLFAGLPDRDQEIGHIVSMLRQDPQDPALQSHSRQPQPQQTHAAPPAPAEEPMELGSEAPPPYLAGYNFPPAPRLAEEPRRAGRAQAWVEAETARALPSARLQATRGLTVGVAHPFNAAEDLASPTPSSASVSPRAALSASSSSSRMTTRGVSSQIPKTEPLSPTSDNDSDGDESSLSTPGRSRHAGPPKEIRRTAHNLIEKKYRCSINDKINEIKVCLVGTEAKMSKSAILKKALEHMQALERQNAELRSRNAQLRARLAEATGQRSSDAEAVSPNSVSDSDDSRSRHTSGGTSSGLSKSLRPMMDRSRVTMFVFMLALIAFNPAQLLLSNGAFSGKGGSVGGVRPAMAPGSRVLHEFSFEDEAAEREGWGDFAFRVLCISALNVLVVTCFLARLLVYGEPLYPGEKESAEWTPLHHHKAEAEKGMWKRDAGEAAFQMGECLKSLGRPPPASRLDELMSLVWQLFRQGLNRLYVGKWLARQGRNGLPSPSVLESNRRTALLYHQLHQLNLLGYGHGSWLSGLANSLAAVNLAEASGSAIGAEDLVSVYVHAALRVRKSLPSLRLLQSYFLSKASRVVKKTDVALGSNLFWVLEPLGREFLETEDLDEVWTKKAESFFPFAQVASIACPLDFLTAAFKVHLLERSLSSGATGRVPQVLAKGDSVVNGYSMRELKEISYLLVETSRGRGSEGGDAVGRWWGHVITCAVDWLRGETEQARVHYEEIRRIPEVLRREALPMAFGYAFCVRRLCLFQRDKLLLVPEHSAKGAEALERARDAPCAQPRLFRVMAQRIHDWLLSGLFDVWASGVPKGREGEYWRHPAAPNLAALFRRLLASARSSEGPAARLKLESFEIAGRVLSGANPSTTAHRLLKLQRTAREDLHLRLSDRNRIQHLLRLHGL